jgi:hypothetical protein
MRYTEIISESAPEWQDTDYMRGYRSVMENVPIAWLKHLTAGNPLRRSSEEIDELAEDIKQNGMNNPVIITVGKNTRTAMLGEGNHRLEACIRAGYTSIPARCIVGSEYGSNLLPQSYCDADLIPQPDTYFTSDAKPSKVFKSLANHIHEAGPFKLSASDLRLPQQSIVGGFKDLMKGQYSHSKGPLSVTSTDDGGFAIGDGIHRFLQGLLTGSKRFTVKIDTRYATDFHPTKMWKPDLSSPTFGIEQLGFSTDNVMAVRRALLSV